MPRLSIVIPSIAQHAELEETLVSVLQHRPDLSEVLVVHDGTYEDPYQLHEEVAFVAAPRGWNLAQMLNLGIAAARAPIVHILLGGVQATDGWVEPALRHFDDEEIASVAPLARSLAKPTRIAAAGVAFSASGRRWLCGAGHNVLDARIDDDHVAGPALLAGFFRKSHLESVGGFDISLSTRFLDADLALCLRAAGWISVTEPGAQVIAPACCEELGDAFTVGKDGQRLFARYKQRFGAWGHVVNWAALVGDGVGAAMHAACRARFWGRLRGMFASRERSPGRASGLGVRPALHVSEGEREFPPSRSQTPTSSNVA